MEKELRYEYTFVGCLDGKVQTRTSEGCGDASPEGFQEVIDLFESYEILLSGQLVKGNNSRIKVQDGENYALLQFKAIRV